MNCYAASLEAICDQCHATKGECDFYDAQCSGPFEKKANPMACIVPLLFVFAVGTCMMFAIWYWVLARLL